MSFETNWLRWPYAKQSRTFRVYVVEPVRYRPSEHSNVFDSVMSKLFALDSVALSSEAEGPAIETPVDADLIVFPEAFLSAEDLVKTLNKLANLQWYGCIHVGLRPSYGDKHLFPLADIRKLLTDVIANAAVENDDLKVFSKWLELQGARDFFNLACVFMLDREGRVRVCLHPKIVRSRYEFSPLDDGHMKEADLLSLITLVPINRTFMSVTVQPLICSDALGLSRDNGGAGPLYAFSEGAASFPENTPDHVDIVSLSLCTPVQRLDSQVPGESYLTWHSEFRSSFAKASEDALCPRHHFATFVMSNFGSIDGFDSAGLSGVFMPVPLNKEEYPPFVSLSSYGGAEGADVGWLSALNAASFSLTERLTNSALKVHDKKGRAHLAFLDGVVSTTAQCATIFGFTINRLARDMPRSVPALGLSQLDVRKVHDRDHQSNGTEEDQEV